MRKRKKSGEITHLKSKKNPLGSTISSPLETQNQRAQTTVDFFFGMVFFLGAVGLLLVLTGGFFVEGTLDEADTTPEASHIANHLVNDQLAGSDMSSARHLNNEKTENFFDEGEDPTLDDLPADSNLNIRVMMSHTGNDTPPAAFNGNEELTLGDEPDAAAESEVSITATLDGSSVRITVITWP